MSHLEMDSGDEAKCGGDAVMSSAAMSSAFGSARELFIKRDGRVHYSVPPNPNCDTHAELEVCLTGYDRHAALRLNRRSGESGLGFNTSGFEEWMASRTSPLPSDDDLRRVRSLCVVQSLSVDLKTYAPLKAPYFEDRVLPLLRKCESLEVLHLDCACGERSGDYCLPFPTMQKICAAVPGLVQFSLHDGVCLEPDALLPLTSLVNLKFLRLNKCISPENYMFMGSDAIYSGEGDYDDDEYLLIHGKMRNSNKEGVDEDGLARRPIKPYTRPLLELAKKIAARGQLAELHINLTHDEDIVKYCVDDFVFDELQTVCGDGKFSFDD